MGLRASSIAARGSAVDQGAPVTFCARLLLPPLEDWPRKVREISVETAALEIVTATQDLTVTTRRR